MKKVDLFESDDDPSESIRLLHEAKKSRLTNIAELANELDQKVEVLKPVEPIVMPPIYLDESTEEDPLYQGSFNFDEEDEGPFDEAIQDVAQDGSKESILISFDNSLRGLSKDSTQSLVSWIISGDQHAEVPNKMSSYVPSS